MRLLSVLGSGDESLADMRDSLPAMINTPEVRFPCAEERKFQVVEEVRERLRGMDGYDDALYAGVRLLSVLGSGDESLADMRDSLPAMINTPEVRFPCAEERKFQVVEEVRERLRGMDGITVHDIALALAVHGVRVQSDDGWWLLRASNTQAVLVARCEADSEEGLKRLKGTLAGQLRASGLDAPDLA